MNPARTFSLVVLLLFLSSGASASAAGTDFAVEAAPLLQKYCADCHGNQTTEARINLQQLAASPEFGANFKTWEKVLGMLQQKNMPPELMPQPTDQERKAIIGAIHGALDRFIEENAGDPGPVVMRRLTSAEYDYTIQDLTGLDLPLQRQFINDAVGGEGFTNVGRVQFMQDSALQQYLEAAEMVASHAVIGSGPLDFFNDPGQTGLELSAIKRIQEIYRRHGFRTGAGEGAVPFGLDRYPRAFYVAWQDRHRKTLGLGETTLAQLAEAEGLSVRFAEHIRRVLTEPNATFPISAVIEQWRALPSPSDDRTAVQQEVRAGCDDIYRLMRNWQKVLAASTGDEEEAAVLTGNNLQVTPTHTFEAKLDWPEGAATAVIKLSITPASNRDKAGPIVLWKKPRIRFRSEDKRRLPPRPLRTAVTETSRNRLGFGRHPKDAKLDKDDFALVAPVSLTIELDVPESMTEAELLVEAMLDTRHGAGAPVRCTITDGTVQGETIAESGGHSALLVDADWDLYDNWKRGVLEFARNLPEASHREPAPSDRDPIPAPFDNTYNSTERNLFHYRIKYHRDDEFLVTHILDDATRRRLDQAWTDLLFSFEYHDAYLRFVAGKYDLDLQGRGIADLDRDWIARLPDEPRRFVQRLHQSDLAGQKRLQAAQPGHVEDALRFAERAWRRPLSEREKTRLRSFYESLRQNGELVHTKAIRALLARILVAPAFLYRVEPPAEQHGHLVSQAVVGSDRAFGDRARQPQAQTGPDAKRAILPLSDWDLASRLSYFLWSSLPDSELRRAAEAGRLQNPDELTRQVERMLRDPKARRLATEFFGQWFGFYRFDDYRGIDTGRFSEFTDSLKAAMYDEAVSFFEYIIREDRPVREILFADYTFLNLELARHYGVDAGDIPDERPELVDEMDEHHRGGLLRLGAVLTATSAPLRTSPVKRGDWILRRVLDSPVPPPPPDAGSIPADDVLADGKTVRERLEAHRREASCVNCHSRIDPLGFALEHFDPIGRWRDSYRDGQAIDSSGTLHDGTKIAGPKGLRQYLRDHEKQFRRTLCSKLLGYALGRAVIASDRPLIDRMMADLEEDGRFSTLVLRIVTSPQFRRQRSGAQAQAETQSTSGVAEERKGPDHDNR